MCMHPSFVQLLCTDFHSASAFHSLLAALDSQFKELKCHEEIEDHHIVGLLLSRLPNNAKTTLENDLHSDSRCVVLYCVVCVCVCVCVCVFLTV